MLTTMVNCLGSLVTTPPYSFYLIRGLFHYTESDGGEYVGMNGEFMSLYSCLMQTYLMAQVAELQQ